MHNASNDVLGLAEGTDEFAEIPKGYELTFEHFWRDLYFGGRLLLHQLRERLEDSELEVVAGEQYGRSGSEYIFEFAIAIEARSQASEADIPLLALSSLSVDEEVEFFAAVLYVVEFLHYDDNGLLVGQGQHRELIAFSAKVLALGDCLDGADDSELLIGLGLKIS